MTIGDRIAQLAKYNGLAVSKVERDLDFSNGYIRRLKETIPFDKAVKVAEYFDVSVDYIFYGEDKVDAPNGYYINEETAQVAQELFENKELRMLFDAAKDATPEDLLMVKDLLLRLKKE